MNILAVDTSCDTLGISLFNGDDIVFEFVKNAKFKMVEELFPLLLDLRKHGLDLNRIDCLGVVVGPGNFTSLRVGISFVKVLSFSFNIPIVPVVSLDVLGYQMREMEEGVALIKAYGGLFYTALYSKGIRVSDFEVKGLDEIHIPPNSGVAGNGVKYIDRKDIIKFEEYIRPSVLAEVTQMYFLKGKGVDHLSLSPFYLQRIKAEEKLEEG